METPGTSTSKVRIAARDAGFNNLCMCTIAVGTNWARTQLDYLMARFNSCDGPARVFVWQWPSGTSRFSATNLRRCCFSRCSSKIPGSTTCSTTRRRSRPAVVQWQAHHSGPALSPAHMLIASRNFSSVARVTTRTHFSIRTCTGFPF